MIRTFRLVLKMALPAAAALTLAGCLSLGGKPPPTLFSFTPAQAEPAGQTTSGTSQGAIVVLEPESDQRLSVNRVLVTVDESNVAYLKKAQWVARPARLFQNLVAETIRARSSRLVFTDAEASTSGAMRLAGRLLDAGYDAQSQSVIVRYDAIRESAGNQVSTRRFEAREPVAKPDPKLIGPALNRVANQVASDVAGWVG
ncbi:ABC-type transport auxiliary lipoprotein family protein [Parablastomonas sp. CN1-191]|uniref:ABC-type transport auxiliary lipoprotein family protein n=1 Tax=Parablastomonas sp. CN1-191 TaxID=3400908 RepID=UPI003BF89FA4